MKQQHRADLLLAFATACWGSSCVLTKLGLGEIEVFNLIALRFLIAFALSAVVFSKRIRNVGDLKKLLANAALIGWILFVTYGFNNFGIRYTSVSNAGFLTCIAGLFVPFVAYALNREPIRKKIILSAVFSAAGVYLLTVSGELSFQIGDLLCILCSACFALHITVTGRMSKEVDPVCLGVFQLGFVGVYSAVASFLLEIPRLPATGEAWLIVLVLSVFCSAAAFIIQTVAQKYTSPAHTGIIFALEPVFAMIFAFAVLGETLTLSGMMGAGLMFASILIMETRLTETIEERIKGKWRSKTAE